MWIKHASKYKELHRKFITKHILSLRLATYQRVREERNVKRKKKLRDMREREYYNTVDEETQIRAIERGRERLTLRGD